MKKTIEEKLHSRNLKKPNFIFYNLLANVWKLTVAKKYHLEHEFIDDPKEEKGPYILISNHASRSDYIFTAIPLLPQTFNFVCGFNEFFRSHLHLILKLFNVIPKKNFTPDIYSVMQMKRIISKGGRICIFLEGMSSISGGSQPVAIGSAKLLKWLNVPVYESNIQGGYLTAPKYNLNDRVGKVKVTFKMLFSKEDLQKYSVDEMTDILNKELYTNDYEYNKKAKTFYESDEIALHLEQLLYRCPKCNHEFEMSSKSDEITCTHCHNTVKMDNYYNLTAKEGSITLEDPKVWFDFEREETKKEIQDPNFFLEDEVDIGFLPKYKWLKNKKTSLIQGKGLLRIDHNGITFNGTKNGKPFNFKLELSETPTYGMCTDASRFYTFLKGGEFIEFYPHRKSTIKWLHVTEELHRMHGGLWKDYKKD